MKPISDKKCSHPDCEETRAFAGWQKNGNAIWRKKCQNHYNEELYTKKGFDSMVEYLNSSHPYRKHRKTFCENKDERLGFKCTTTILLTAQLEVDHIDGDPSNNEPENLQTLCSCCHKYKTIINEDYKSPGRISLGIKY